MTIWLLSVFDSAKLREYRILKKYKKLKCRKLLLDCGKAGFNRFFGSFINHQSHASQGVTRIKATNI
jgi:hypothetical protein